MSWEVAIPRTPSELPTPTEVLTIEHVCEEGRVQKGVSGIMNIALDFDHLFSLGKEQALKKCIGEQVAWGTRSPGR